MKQALKILKNQRTGQTMLEYIMLVGVVAVAGLVGFALFNDTCRTKLVGGIATLDHGHNARNAQDDLQVSSLTRFKELQADGSSHRYLASLKPTDLIAEEPPVFIPQPAPLPVQIPTDGYYLDVRPRHTSPVIWEPEHHHGGHYGSDGYDSGDSGFGRESGSGYCHGVRSYEMAM